MLLKNQKILRTFICDKFNHFYRLYRIVYNSFIQLTCFLLKSLHIKCLFNVILFIAINPVSGQKPVGFIKFSTSNYFHLLAENVIPTTMIG